MAWYFPLFLLFEDEDTDGDEVRILGDMLAAARDFFLAFSRRFGVKRDDMVKVVVAGCYLSPRMIGPLSLQKGNFGKAC